jgi:hypothetical protein
MDRGLRLILANDARSRFALVALEEALDERRDAPGALAWLARNADAAMQGIPVEQHAALATGRRTRARARALALRRACSSPGLRRPRAALAVTRRRSSASTSASRCGRAAGVVQCLPREMTRHHAHIPPIAIALIVGAVACFSVSDTISKTLASKYPCRSSCGRVGVRR